ncbi:MAG: OsmC family protein [Gammaproteobacteria bacterium]|jgi:putative redox protein|nr:OsmC family protein [Gammaproteobacteria bacterium]MBT5603182.1 OsmC family protein [Gammaproteobacteria bacterium]
MKGNVKWLDGKMFLAESASGHTVVMDGPEENGGRNIGFRPMEMVLLGMAGCTSYDVIHILGKARQNVTDCVAEVEAIRADSVPAVFTDIHLHFLVTGVNLKQAQVERAIKLSSEKYCSASMMLEAGGVKITYDYEIRQAA